jgi:DnaJ domain
MTRAGGRTSGRDAFSLLGVNPEDQLTDDEVRAAWRRIAAATHPDRADGGDPERFAAAAAAYTELRTTFGRNEARAALTQTRPAPSAGLWRRVSSGRPGRLALRLAIAAGAATGGVLAAGGGPAGPALVVGAATWLVLTSRGDLGAR